MQLANIPDKLPLPFASAGGKRTIPVPSQIGIDNGAASLTDGFPPLTRTNISAGGIPPNGLDMNGILFEMSAIDRWNSVGGSFPYDGTFAATISGYPKGAQLLRADGLGFWLSTVDDNATDPDAGGAGWVPVATYGAAGITMTNANVTLNAVQWGRPIILITGVLAGNLNLIFPTLLLGWSVINATTGAFTITAKTAAGSGAVVLQGAATEIVGDGTNILSSSTNVTVASQAATDTGTNDTTFISPLKLAKAAKTLKASVKFDGTGAILGTAINVSSVTRNAVGDYTINFTTAFANANYRASLACKFINNFGSGNLVIGQHYNVAPTVSAYRLMCSGVASYNGNDTPIEANFFGDQ